MRAHEIFSKQHSSTALNGTLLFVRGWDLHSTLIIEEHILIQPLILTFFNYHNFRICILLSIIVAYDGKRFQNSFVPPTIKDHLQTYNLKIYKIKNNPISLSKILFSTIVACDARRP